MKFVYFFLIVFWSGILGIGGVAIMNESGLTDMIFPCENTLMNSAPCNLQEQIIITGLLSVVSMTIGLYFFMRHK